MRNLSIALSLSLLTLFSCGGGEKETTTENEIVTIPGYVDLDLSEYGYELVIQIPGEDQGLPEISETSFGKIEIRVGKMFGIEIADGPGDFALLKSDLDGDLVYKSKILAEDSTHIIYEREIPDSGIETEYHFFYVANIKDRGRYEIQNLKDEFYSQTAIEKMVEAVKTLRAKQPGEVIGEQPA